MEMCGQHPGSKEIYFKDLSTRLILFSVREGESPITILICVNQTLIMFDLLRLVRELVNHERLMLMSATAMLD